MRLYVLSMAISVKMESSAEPRKVEAASVVSTTVRAQHTQHARGESSVLVCFSLSFLSGKKEGGQGTYAGAYGR